MPEAERPNPDSRADVIIVGGGASGALMAFHLLRDPTAEVRVTLIEKRPQLGRGVAYSTTNPDHLLNVRAASMSALRDEPDHFWSWLCATANTAYWEWKPGNDPLCFAPRMIYGDYLASLTTPFVAHGGRPGRLRIVHGECRSIDEGRSGVTAKLADGSHHSADFGILATGHDARSKTSGCYVDAWTAPSDAGVDPGAKVLIVGTGLTMVDYVLSLDACGHTGPIIAMSRRGLLPREDRLRRALSSTLRQMFHWEPVSLNSAAGCEISLRLMRRRAPIGAASSTVSGPSTSRSGSSFRRPRAAAFCGTGGHGGTSIDIACAGDRGAHRRRHRVGPSDCYGRQIVRRRTRDLRRHDPLPATWRQRHRDNADR